MIKGETLQLRAEWRTGVVDEVVRGRDGKIRRVGGGAKLRTTSKKSHINSTVYRPVQKLIKLEINSDINYKEKDLSKDLPKD